MNRILPKRRSIIVILILTLLISNPVLVSASQYKVTRVTDGDTIQVVAGGTKTTVRLVGIDASEVSHGKNRTGQPFSKVAAKHPAAMVLNKVEEGTRELDL
jgi:endonuclease YncB( thermonuclease family)